MKPFQYFILLLISCCLLNCQLSGEREKNALEIHKELMAEMTRLKIEPLSERYFQYYFQQQDLLSKIEGEPAYVMREYYYAAFNFIHFGLPQESIKNYIAFLDYYDKYKDQLNEKDSAFYHTRVSRAYGFMASQYSKLRQFDSARVQHERNIEYTRNEELIFRASALNNFGLFFYWDSKELDTAMVLFKEAFRMMEEGMPNDHLIGSIRDNIADIYMETGQPLLALPLYTENFEFYQQNFEDRRDNLRLMHAAEQSVRASLAINQLSEAQLLFSEFSAIYLDTVHKLYAYPPFKVIFLKAQEQLLQAEKKLDEAYKVSLEQNRLTDSIENAEQLKSQTTQNRINRLGLDHLNRNFLLEKQQKDNTIRNQRMNIWLISLSGLILISILFSLYIKRKQHLQALQNKRELAECAARFATLKNEHLNEEISSKQRDLADFAINLNHSQEWARELKSKWQEMKGTKGRQRKKLSEEFEKELTNKTSFDSETIEFYERLDTLSDSF